MASSQLGGSGFTVPKRSTQKVGPIPRDVWLRELEGVGAVDTMAGTP